MNILFDFEVWDDPALDKSLSGILTCLKHQMIERLKSVEHIINMSTGVICIRFIKGKCGISLIGFKEEAVKVINEIIGEFDFSKCIEIFKNENFS